MSSNETTPIHYSAVILDTFTGERRTYVDTYDWTDIDALAHQWTDGNYGCDCNRRRFFARVGNEPEPESTGVCCGSGRYRVDRLVTTNGREVEIDA